MCTGRPVAPQAPRIFKNGRHYCGHPDCLDPQTHNVKPEAEHWKFSYAVHTHYQAVHMREGDSMFRCEICEKGFMTLGLLNQHRKNIHIKVKSFLCSNFLEKLPNS